MTPYWKAVLFRLYLTAQVLAVVIGGGMLVVFGALLLQGRSAAARDFECFDRESARRTAEATCTPAARAAIAEKEKQYGPPGSIVPVGTEVVPFTEPEAQCIQAEAFLKWMGSGKRADFEPILLPDEGAEMAAARACGIEFPAERYARSENAWYHFFGQRGVDPWLLVQIAATAIAPALSLFAAYRWVRWLARPPTNP